MKSLAIIVSVSILTYGMMLDCIPGTLVQDNECSCGGYNCGVGNICQNYKLQSILYCTILVGLTTVVQCQPDSSCPKGQVCFTIGNNGVDVKICLDTYCPYNIVLNHSCKCSSSLCDEGQICSNGQCTYPQTPTTSPETTILILVPPTTVSTDSEPTTITTTS